MKLVPNFSITMTSCLALSTFVLAVPSGAQIKENREARQESRRDAAPVTHSEELTTRRGTFSSDKEVDIDTDGERAYRSRTLTGPEGDSVGVLGQIQRTENGTETSQTFTDRDGDTAGRSFSRSVEEDSYTREREAYTRSGETASASNTLERTDDGASRTLELETSSGRGGAVENEVTRTDDGGSASRTVTDAEGNTVGSRETTVTNDEDGASKTTTITDADGEAYEYSREVDKK